MKATINGTRYDTTKAVAPIGTFEADCYITDWTFWKATLYRTPNGSRYFLAGEGGRMTIFAARGPNGLERGEKIIPMGKQEALAWACKYLSPEDAAEAFPAAFPRPVPVAEGEVA